MAAQDLRAALMARVETVAVYYCGEPNRAMSSRSQLRFGRHGSLAVEIAGDRTGIWCDHEAGQGGDLLDLIQRELGCCSFSETLAEAERFVGGCSAPIPPRAAPRAQGGDKQRKIDLAIKVYNESRPIQGTLGEAYLERRGLFVPDGMDALRFHPHCPRGQDRVPAMIAAMRSVATGEITAIHRTFIGPDGAKARLHEGDTAKTMLGQAGGAAIMLDDFGAVTTGLIVSEGIENGLVARCGGWAPVWALGSAGALERLPVLGGVEALTILADADEPGREAATVCAERWATAGAEVRVVEPLAAADWNDVVAAVRP